MRVKQYLSHIYHMIFFEKKQQMNIKKSILFCYFTVHCINLMSSFLTSYYTVLIYIYRILHELSFKINIYEMCLGNVTKRASGKIYNVSGTSFIKVYT